MQKKRRWIIDAIGHSSDSDTDSATVFLTEGANNSSTYNHAAFNQAHYSNRLRIDPSLFGGSSVSAQLSDEDEDDREDCLDRDASEEEAMDAEDAADTTEDGAEQLAGDKRDVNINYVKSPITLGKCTEICSTEFNSNSSVHDNFKWKDKLGTLKKELSVESNDIRSDELLSANAVKTEPKDNDWTDRTFNEDTESDQDDEATEDSADQTDDSDEDFDSDNSESRVSASLVGTGDDKVTDGVSGARLRQINRINTMMREHLLRKSYSASYRLEGWVSFTQPATDYRDM